MNSFHSFKSYIFLETVYILHVALVRRLIGVITYFDVAFIVIHYMAIQVLFCCPAGVQIK